MLYISAAMPSWGVCLFVCHVRWSCRNDKHISIFFTVGYPHHSSFFSTPNLMAIFRRRSPNDGVESRWGWQQSRFATNIWLRRVLSTVRPPSVIHTTALDRGSLVTLIAGISNRHRLLFAGDERRSVYDKKPQCYAEDNRTEFNCTHALVNLKPK